MADRPSIFSAPMVRALLDGRKSQTRRVLTAACDEPPAFVSEGSVTALDENDTPYRWPRIAAAGDRLWVRESIAPVNTVPSSAIYRADGDRQPGSCCGCAWRSPIHMPRWASRLTLTVTDVRVQRLGEISEEDAVAEGIGKGGAVGLWGWWDYAHDPKSIARRFYADPRDSFRSLWNSLHGPDAWDANPWVAALTFTTEQRNIDHAG